MDIPENPDSQIYEDHDLTPTAKKVIEYSARNPESTPTEASEQLNIEISLVGHYYFNQIDLIHERAEELGIDTERFDPTFSYEIDIE